MNSAVDCLAASDTRDFSARSTRFIRSNARLIAGGLIIPNLLTLLTMTSLVDIGLPPRTEAMLFYACVAMLARRLPFAVTVMLFLGVLGFDIVRTLSLSFAVAPVEFLAAIDRAQRIQFFASPLYLALIVTIAATTIAALACLSRRAALAGAHVTTFFALATGLAVVDFVTNVSPHFHFGAAMGRGEPVQSAAEVSGFMQAAGANGGNVVLVMVESLGYLRDPAARARIAAPLYDPQLARDYTVTAGNTTYFGSTTSGEMRELCNTRTFYQDYVRTDAHACLPGLLARRGYSTVAVHGFSGGMFERDAWYPVIGFQRALFGEDLVRTTRRTCGAAFRGACDADLAPLIAAASRHSADDARPRFIYWLTLNSHVPIAPAEARTDFRCGDDGGSFGRVDVCRMAELWHDVFAGVAQLARDPAMASAEILIVGDHAPPLWSKRGRAQFEPGKVAWYRLQPRRDDGVRLLEAAGETKKPVAARTTALADPYDFQ
jgi:hypothetical protein